MRYELYVPILLLGVTNIFAWLVKYYDHQFNLDLHNKIKKLEKNQYDISNDLNSIILNLDKYKLDCKESYEKLEKKLDHLYKNYNMLSVDFESNMKTKKEGIISNWF